MALTVGFLAACGGSSGGSDHPADGSVGATPDGSVAAGDSSMSDAGTPQPVDGGGSDAAAKDGAAKDATVKTGTAPTLSMVNARQVGRAGADLRIDFTGADPDKDIATLQVQLFDSAMSQIGTDSILPIVTPITAAAGGPSYVLLTDALTMAALGTHTDFSAVKVTLIDAHDNASATMDATVSKQPEVALGNACDATFVTNRCASGLGCKGTAPNMKCSAGEAPTLSMVGYYSSDMGNDPLGPRIVMAGNDPDGDVKTYTLRFLDASGTMPVSVNLNNDPTMLVTTFGPAPLGTTEGTTAFSFSFRPSDDFLNTVAKVGITVADSRAAASAEMITNVLAVAPNKSSGATCDPRGFDYCKGTAMNPLVCAPSGTSNKCTSVATARTNACASALVLDPGNGVTSVKGMISRASLWDQPVGCSNAPVNQPDSLVKLILAADSPMVTLSTDNVFTSFDTELYALRTCTDTPAIFDPRTSGSMDLWCNDNQQDSSSNVTSPKSVLVLRNLTAGTYFIVVDSTPATDQGLLGDNFQVTVSVQ